MLTGYWIGIAVQIPAGRFCAATQKGAYVGRYASGILITPELGIARDQDEGAVRVRLNESSRQRGLDRILVTPQMIKYPGLIGEPGGGPGIAGTKAPPGLNRFESFLVAAVEAQSNSKVKMAESKVSVQLDRTASMRYGGPDVASPMACLREHILGLRVFAIERHSLKSGFPCLAHKWREVVDRAIIPLHDQRAGEPEVGVREVGIERERLFEQAVGCDAIGPSALVHMPDAALAIIPGAHVLRPLGDYALAFGAGQRGLDRRGDTRRDVVLHRENVSQISVVTLGPEMGTGGGIDQLAGDAHAPPGPAHARSARRLAG